MENKNFNLTTSVSTPIEYYKVLILQRLNDLNEAWEHYSKGKHIGISVELNIVHARTESLYNALAPYLERKLPPEVILEMEKGLFIDEPNESDLRKYFFIINKQLDIDRVTRLDTKNVYDGTKIEDENKEFGL
jgi:hypothetical protein